MKKLILILTFLFPITSFAEWTLVNKNTNGDSFYIDFDRIKKQDGFVYYWILIDNFKPNRHGDLSSKIYVKNECKSSRWKILRDVYYTGQMNKGTVRHSSNTPDEEWTYSPLLSASETQTKKICSH